MSVRTMHPTAFNQIFIEKGYTLDQWLNELLNAVDEIKTKLNALDDKLNADTGITDTDYNTTIEAELPEEFQNGST